MSTHSSTVKKQNPRFTTFSKSLKRMSETGYRYSKLGELASKSGGNKKIETVHVSPTKLQRISEYAGVPTEFAVQHLDVKLHRT